MNIEKYKNEYRDVWDRFVSMTEDAHFVFYRAFIEYHKNKFEDHSLLIFDKGNLIAILPACKSENGLYSHIGLPFAGIIISETCKWSIWPEIIDTILIYLKENEFRKFSVTMAPRFYQSKINEAQLYFLRDKGFQLQNQKLSCVIPLSSTSKHNVSDKIPTYLLDNVKVEFDSLNYQEFYALLINELDKKYNAIPTHSLPEIFELKNNLDQNIELINAYYENALVGSILLFKYKTTIKAQYIISNKNNISDLIIKSIFEKYKSSYQYFDLGTSNSLEDGSLNMGNLEFKIKHGSIGYVVEKYEISI